jgi:hypothetical protein
MIPPMIRFRVFALAGAPARLGILVFCGVLALSLAALAQGAATAPQTSPAATQESQPAAQQPPAGQTTQPAPAPAPVQPSTAAPGSAAQQAAPGEITEEELRRLLVGKELFLRGGYLDNSLSFNEHGALIGHAPQGAESGSIRCACPSTRCS